MSTSSTSSSSPVYFNGTSTYSSDLQQVITRELQIASLPMQLLQNQQSQLTSEQTAMQSLSSSFSGVQSAITGIDSATGLSTYGATVSDPSVANATVSSGVLNGTLTLDVLSLGSKSSAMSNSGLLTVTDPTQDNISTGSSYTLTVDSKPYTLNLTDTSLDGLVNAINSSGAGVSATIVNVGGSTPDYRLSIQSQNYAADTIQLTDSGDNPLMTTLATGSPVTYQVNGQPSTPIESNSRTVTLAPGLSVNILAAGSTDITVSQNGSSIANAINSFVTAYNAAVDQLSQSHGTGGNALTGNSIVFSLEQTLQQLTNYTGSGNITALSDLGLTFDSNGHLQFDETGFLSTASQSMNDVLSFLGSVSGNNGFLGIASQTLTGVMDTTTGILPQAMNDLATEVTNIGTQINDDEDKLTTLQQTLTQQMAQADALIASLQQQNTNLTNLFSAMKVNAQLISG
ncbi:MAG TPA: flagellar filament capping protein FliD [Terriglobales bacterium]|nr:flagellar filament capping protein FliD [Terriglobales bacterium]